MENKRKIKGAHISRLVFPTLALILLLQLLIIIFSSLINSYSNELSKKTKRQTDVSNMITSILASSSKLSDTAITFVHSPTIPVGPTGYKLNTGPLEPYYSQIILEKADPDYIDNELKKYSLKQEIMDIIDEVIEEYRFTINHQSHALHLVYHALKDDTGITDEDKQLLDNVIEAIPEYVLTDTELAYTADEAIEQANMIIFSKEYSNTKGKISTNVNLALDKFENNTDSQIEEYNTLLRRLRKVLWGFTFLTIFISVVFFAILLRYLVFPLIRFSRTIDNNNRLNVDNRLYETNVLANAYNELLDRHKEFEDQLIEVAEKDSLTGLPNRYSYNEFLQKELTADEAVCVFVCDINNLKYVNDTFGHAKGDELIKEASLCIKECFKGENNCYRIGGDEFVAIMKNITKEDVNDYLKSFQEMQKKYNVSIAVGYSYCDDVLNVGYESIIKEADEMMYVNKKEMKKQ